MIDHVHVEEKEIEIFDLGTIANVAVLLSGTLIFS